MSSYDKGDGPGTPLSDYHIAQLFRVGSPPEDYKAALFSVPGSARRNMVHALVFFRGPSGRAVVDALSELLANLLTVQRSGVRNAVWQRGALFKMAASKIEPAAEGLEHNDWSLLLEIALLERPELAAADSRRGEGPQWVSALRASGWRDSTRCEKEMEVAR